MKLRARQEVFVERCLGALDERHNTLGVAPTGAGKTVMLSAVAGKRSGAKLILQHRDELVEQNRRTFWMVNPGVQSDLYTAERKRWIRGDGATFAMAQTLVRNLDSIPHLDLCIVDEAHHSAAPSYIKIFDALRRANPAIEIFGVTATATRGDKKALRSIYDNVADQISLKELIETGFLVKPRTFVVDIGTQDALRGIRKSANDFDMAEVEAIMDKEVLNDKVVEKWRELAGGRQTVAFAATVAHAEHVADAFRAGGVNARVVHGDMAGNERGDTLKAFDRAEFQVLVNVAVLTEGWDCQPVSCVLLLRPSSYKSTLIQMIGRGLRKVDPERYPGVVKDDCIVIDFGTSILQHGSIEDEVNLNGKHGVTTCPECQALIPGGCRECPLCGYAFPVLIDAPTKNCAECGEANPVAVLVCKNCGHAFPIAERSGVLEDFVLTEVDLLEQSPYRWESMFDGGLVLMATAFDVWAAVICYGGRWHAIGGSKVDGVKHLANTGDRIVALAAADDLLREKGDQDGAKKTKRWLNEPPTDKQLAALKLDAVTALGLGVTKYRAACSMTWRWQERVIRAKLEQARLAG